MMIAGDLEQRNEKWFLSNRSHTCGRTIPSIKSPFDRRQIAPRAYLPHIVLQILARILARLSLADLSLSPQLVDPSSTKDSFKNRYERRRAVFPLFPRNWTLDTGHRTPSLHCVPSLVFQLRSQRIRICVIYPGRHHRQNAIPKTFSYIHVYIYMYIYIYRYIHLGGSDRSFTTGANTNDFHGLVDYARNACLGFTGWPWAKIRREDSGVTSRGRTIGERKRGAPATLR